MDYCGLFAALAAHEAPEPPKPALTPAEAALAKVGIAPDAPYYAGALAQVEQALSTKKPTSARFWQEYRLSLCAHLGRLEQAAEKETEQEMLRVSIRTVGAILNAWNDEETPTRKAIS